VVIVDLHATLHIGGEPRQCRRSGSFLIVSLLSATHNCFPVLLVLLARRRGRLNHFAYIVLHLRRAGTGQPGKVSKTVNSPEKLQGST
jgi:hypothetical protein